MRDDAVMDMPKSPKTVGEYIKMAPKEHQKKLRELRSLIKSSAPKALEKLSYGMPYYGHKGRLAYFAMAKEHIGLYIMPATLKGYENEVAKYRTGKATLRFPFNRKLPSSLIKKLVRHGVKVNEGKNAKR